MARDRCYAAGLRLATEHSRLAEQEGDGMRSPTTIHTWSNRPLLRPAAWILLFACLGAAGQSNIPQASPPGSFPTISPPAPPHEGLAPWLFPGQPRFFTGSVQLKAFLETVNNPQASYTNYIKQLVIPLCIEEQKRRIVGSGTKTDMCAAVEAAFAQRK